MSELVPEQTVFDGGARRFQLRSAGCAVLTGAALTIVSSLLQQRADIPRGDQLGLLSYVDGRPWFAAALAGVLGMLCWAVGFGVAGRVLRDPVSRSIARMAEPVLVTAVAVFAVTYAHDGFSTGVLARSWAAGELAVDAATSDARVVESLVGGTSVLAQLLTGLSLLLYATAVLRSGQYSRVLCWAGIVGAGGWFVGGSVLFLRLPGASFGLMLPFVGIATVWALGVGVSLLGAARTEIKEGPERLRP